MTPLEWACLARDAYTVAPDIGPENSAGRIVFNTTQEGRVLSIPGTNNQACALADADAIPYATGVGRVHKGIWLAFDAVWQYVSGLSLFGLVGHSEGAAGAIYLAVRLCLIDKAPAVVWAFEPPRTSIDGTLAKILAQYGVELHIMHHGNDLVPDIPVSLPFQEWQHAGPVTKFGNPAFPFPNIKDHLIEGIIADLTQ